jgi:photosystem II stability/assembly factor-like uncharacterized protein
MTVKALCRPSRTMHAAAITAMLIGPALASAQDPAAATATAAPQPAATAAAQPPMGEMQRLAPQSLILDVAQTAQRGVAVGERGHVLVSASRRDWKQVEGVPTRATLTAVTAVGERVWAVGHDTTILRSMDGGLSWRVQHQQIGAYGMMLRTSDAGQNWELVDFAAAVGASGGTDEAALDEEIDEAEVVDEAAGDEEESWTFDDEELDLAEESDPHLNAITRTGDGSLFIAAERGAAFRSRDNGQTWERLSLPYEGSMFGAIAYAEQHVLVYGLRGHVLETFDLGETWNEIDTGMELSLMGGAALENGGAILTGANGSVLMRSSASAAFEQLTFHNARNETPSLAAVMPLGGKEYVVVGDRGADIFRAP